MNLGPPLRPSLRMAAAKARAFQDACRLRNQDPWWPSRISPYLDLPRLTSSGNVAPVSRRHTSTSNPPILQCAQPRRHASSSSASSSGPSRRAITVTSDDGRYTWNQLSTGEKVARGTQQTFNFLLVSLGLVGTVTVAYLLYHQDVSPSSPTVQFNAAVNRVKSSSECRTLLGPSSQIKAYGESTSSKWAFSRPIAHSTEIDKYGTTHFRMHFNVEGTETGVRGVVTVVMTKSKDNARLEYQTLSLSVKGHETVYLVNKAAERGIKGQTAKMFGIQWR